VLTELDPNSAYMRIGLMQDNIDPLVRPWRMGATLFGIFGALALAIAAIGLYSVIAYMVAQRTQEFGVRLALGATTRRILSLVLSRGMAVSVAGLFAGLVVALYAGRLLEPLLFETSGRDPVVLGGTTLVLLGVSTLACLLPARRAMRVDPVIALRAE
jgi:ABC-type antimicrobial peptide transport system permease subunit